MITFLVRRTGWALVTLRLVVSASLALASLLPADPAKALAGPHANPEAVERIRHELRLDQPLSARYGYYLGHVARGDLGRSYRTEEAVTDTLKRTAPMTALLALGAPIFQLLVGLPVGLFAALRRDSAADTGAMAGRSSASRRRPSWWASA